MTTRFTRRAAMRAGLAAATAPAVWRHGRAADAIEIGAPIALTGPLGSVGQQMKRGCELLGEVESAKGAPLGRPIEMVFADTVAPRRLCAQGAGDGGTRRHSHPDRHHPVVRGARHRAETRRVGHNLHLVGQWRRQADREILRAEFLPRQHLRPDGNARRGTLAA